MQSKKIVFYYFWIFRILIFVIYVLKSLTRNPNKKPITILERSKINSNIII